MNGRTKKILPADRSRRSMRLHLNVRDSVRATRSRYLSFRSETRSASCQSRYAVEAARTQSAYRSSSETLAAIASSACTRAPSCDLRTASVIGQTLAAAFSPCSARRSVISRKATAISHSCRSSVLSGTRPSGSIGAASRRQRRRWLSARGAAVPGMAGPGRKAPRLGRGLGIGTPVRQPRPDPSGKHGRRPSPASVPEDPGRLLA